MKQAPHPPKGDVINRHSPFRGLGGLLFFILLLGCKNDMQKVKMFDRQTLPDQRVEGGIVTYSDNGVQQMRMHTPSICIYSKPEHKTVFPEGVDVDFLQNGTVTVNLKARYAIMLDDRHILKANDSVVIVDYTSGDTTYMEDIIWNQTGKIIYSNHPVRSVNGNRVTYGDGFQSDDAFEDPLILHQRGTIEWMDTV